MKNWREDCLGRLSSASKSPATLLKELSTVAAELDFEYCSYVLTMPFPITKPRVAWSSNYPAGWLERYFSSGYLEVDPLVRRASDGMWPVVWTSDPSKEQPEFWEEARAYGIHCGWALATHGPHRVTGLLSLARSTRSVTESELDEKEPTLVWLAHLIHGFVGAAELTTLVPETAKQLTDRECEVLRWSAAGKTAEEIGRILGITERTVTFHVTSSLCKLNVTNKTQAVAKALLLKLI